MTTLSEARRAWENFKSQYQEKLAFRTGVMGDGRGTAASNVNVPGRDNYIYARDHYEDTRFYQILNRGTVQPAANLPIIIGYDLYSGIEEEQVIGVNFSGFGENNSPEVNPVIGRHHWQHEFQGGDQVTIDSRQFLPGLVYPNDPLGLTVKVGSFVYFWNEWKRFDVTTTKSLAEYRPDSGYVRNVLITLDPEADELRYHPGAQVSTGSLDLQLGRFTIVPAPPPNEIPLGYIRLTNGQTVINWSATENNIGDVRLFANPPQFFLLERLRQLEGYTGNDPNLATLWAATDRVDDVNHALEGLVDVDLTGADNAEVLTYDSATRRWIPGAAGGAGAISYVTTSAEAGLTNERVLTGTTNQINITDNGANATVVLSTPQNIHTGASPIFARATLSTASPGGLFYSNSASSLDQSPDDLFWGTTSRLGVGTSTPLNRFHARDTANAPARLHREQNNNTIGDTLLLDLSNNTGSGGTALGPGILFRGESTTTEERNISRISAPFTDGVDTTRTGALVIEIDDTGLSREMIRCNMPGGIIINDVSADLDFRVESNDNTSIIFADAGLNQVGIGTSPRALLHLLGSVVGNEVLRLETTATNDEIGERVFQNRITTDAAVTNTIHPIFLPASTTIGVEAQVIARMTDGTQTQSGMWFIRGVGSRLSGNVSLFGASGNPNVLAFSADGEWNATLAASATALRVNVTGTSAATITWHTTLRTWRVST